MPRTTKHSSLAPVAPVASVFVAALLAMPVLTFDANQARADVTVSGTVKIKVRTGDRPARVRVRHRTHRTHAPRVRLRIGGGVHVHGHVHTGGFAEPPPPPPPPMYDDCDPPVYVHPTPPPVYRHAQPAPVVVNTPAYRPRLPRLGIGVFAGSINVDERMTGEDVGLFGRLRLTDSLLLEAEVAKTQMESARIDRRVGGALLYDLRPRSRFSAHLLAGAGVTHVDMSDGTWQSKQEYGEVGAGLSMRLTQRLHLSADLRAGARARVDDQPTDQVLKTMAPSSEAEEQYTRGRLSALFYF